MNTDGTPRRVSFGEIEPALQRAVGNEEEAYVSLHADKSVPIEQVVKVMNIAKRNKYKMILATAPEH